MLTNALSLYHTQLQLINGLPAVFRSVVKRYNLAPGDFPDIADFQSKLREQDFTKFNVLKLKLIDDVELVLTTEFPRLMEALPRAHDHRGANDVIPANAPLIYPVVAQPEDDSNPWGEEASYSVKQSSGSSKQDWALNQHLEAYKDQFEKVQKNGLISGGAAKSVLGSSGLPVTTLRTIWELADTDKDGSLDQYEFTIAMFLIEMAKEGHEVPEKLDDEMLPPK